MITFQSSITVFLATFVLIGCTGKQPLSCPQGQTRMLSDTLYFGTTGPKGTMFPAAWREFLDTAITPRFPEGLTVWPADGQWKSDNGTIIREPSYVLNIIHPDTSANEKAIAEIVAAFKARFRQEAVLRVRDVVCTSF